NDRLSEPERVAHVLSRLTFGARPGDAERVAAMGVDRWIAQQLEPEAIPDSALGVALRSIPQWTEPTANMTAVVSPPRPLENMTMAALGKDSAAKAALRAIVVRLAVQPNDLFFAGKVIRAQVSERQLAEVLSDFWANHFSVYSAKMPSREALIVWDRDVLRPRALGKFRDLLGAVAHSPAMLFYLDNHLSTRRGLNENYARELLELHTLGVDGGYTQQDVIEVARALTGWSTQPSANLSVFRFRPEMHDTGSKVVLGHTLLSGRGIEDGEEVLDIIASHPSTARYISFKLARRLVSDDPPPALVDRAAVTFMRTQGDIAEVVRTIVTSKEFFSRAAFRAKVKTPFELVVSVRRALETPADTTAVTARGIGQLGQPTFGWATPDGWPEQGAAWINSGTIYKRIKYAGDIANGGLVFAWRDWTTLASLPLDQQVNGVVRDVLGGVAEPATREAMLGIRTPSNTAATNVGEGQKRLRELLQIALASPEFQRR
ncbi:MAG TPA: DUF1800 domain-containing protein, partial [Gemmatimonadaceae bacterium]